MGVGSKGKNSGKLLVKFSDRKTCWVEENSKYVKPWTKGRRPEPLSESDSSSSDDSKSSEDEKSDSESSEDRSGTPPKSRRSQGIIIMGRVFHS